MTPPPTGAAPAGPRETAYLPAMPAPPAGSRPRPGPVATPGPTAADGAPLKTSLLSAPWLTANTVWRPGATVGGRYQLIRVLGRGGMGEVLLAEDLFLRRPVALKTLRENLAHDPESLMRFRHEVAMAHAVMHEGLARTFDMGEDDGVVYISMEYLQGESLAQRITRGPLPVREVRELGTQVAVAVHAAHRAGIVHRDLKPSNVQLTPDRGPVVMDFGVAAGSATDRAGDIPGGTRSALIRTESSLEGSPPYMAPEQWRCEPQGPPTDVYAFGVILFEALTGRRPFLATGMSKMMKAHLEDRAPSVRSLRPDVPAAVDRLVAQCLEKDAEKRPASMVEVARRLAEPPVVPHILTAAMMLAAVGLILLGGWAVWASASALILDQTRPGLERLAALTATQLDPAALDRVRSPADIPTPEFQGTWQTLERIRDENPDVRYVYTMRKLPEGARYEFVVDADYADEDEDGDGVISEDEEGGAPGMEYDGSEYPAMQRAVATQRPHSDDAYKIDQWGLLLSGYAPLRGKAGDQYLIGVDVTNEPLVRLRTSLYIVFSVLAASAAALIFVLRRRHQRQIA
jgi:hypothetical protein